MVAYLIILLLLLLLGIIFRMMMKGFKNPERKHQRIPADEGVQFEEIRFKTKNDRSLYGWWIFKDSSYPTIILVHGWGRNVERMMPYLVFLNKKKYNLLAFDARNHGNSEKDRHSTMKKFAEDISSSIDFVNQQTNTDHAPIGIIGLSVGGAASIYASAHDNRISSLVTVGAFANPLDVMKLELKKRHVPYWPVGWILLYIVQLVVGLSFNKIAPEKHIKKSPARILLIHGTHDKTVPVSHADRLMTNASRTNTTLWKIEGKGHSNCNEEPGFWTKIEDFFGKTLAGGSREGS